MLRPPLQRLAENGPALLPSLAPNLESYTAETSRVDTRSLTRAHALAFWINLYNAGALILAGRAQRAGKDSVLGVPGGFKESFVTVDGERLSLDDIEHGKLRRFKDPRIHSALVCGAFSCPTLRSEPYSGDSLDAELDDQMRHFLDAGALRVDESERVVRLSRVFLWFGADFARPHRMPTFLPASRRRVLSSLTRWMPEETVDWIEEIGPAVEFQGYDWGLSCTVR